MGGGQSKKKNKSESKKKNKKGKSQDPTPEPEIEHKPAKQKSNHSSASKPRPPSEPKPSVAVKPPPPPAEDEPKEETTAEPKDDGYLGTDVIKKEKALAREVPKPPDSHYESAGGLGLSMDDNSNKPLPCDDSWEWPCPWSFYKKQLGVMLPGGADSAELIRYLLCHNSNLKLVTKPVIESLNERFPRGIQSLFVTCSPSWFHGYMDLAQAELSLLSEKDGSFLIRFSSQNGYFSISAKQDDQIHHWRIDATTGKFSMTGQKVVKDSLLELISYFQNIPLVINRTYTGSGKDRFCLTDGVMRPNFGGDSDDEDDPYVVLPAPDSTRTKYSELKDSEDPDHMTSFIARPDFKESIVPTGTEPIRFSELETGSRLGEGMFGSVYKGKFRGKWVALKVNNVIAPDDVEKFRKEAEMSVNLADHPNVVKSYGICVHSGTPILVMELMAGGTLKEYLTQHGGSVLKNVPLQIKLASDAAEGLAFLHKHKIVHRDIAARNILLTSPDNPQAKIGDFGMSRLLEDGDVAKTSSKGEFPVPWMAPECIRKLYSPKSDVWSFGVMLYELLSGGRMPFHERPAEGLAVNIYKNAIHPNLKDVYKDAHETWKDLLLSCWQKEADNRPTMENVLSTIKSIPQ